MDVAEKERERERLHTLFSISDLFAGSVGEKVCYWSVHIGPSVKVWRV